MSTYYSNGGKGTSAFVGFSYNKSNGKTKQSLYAEVVMYRFVTLESPVVAKNTKIVSYMVIGERPALDFAQFNEQIRWMFALDDKGDMWYNVHGKGESVSYDQWDLYPLKHDYFNKKINLGFMVFYSNGVEYGGNVSGTRGFEDSTNNADFLRELVNYKVDCRGDARKCINSLCGDYSCNLTLFKRGLVKGVEGWNWLPKTYMRVEFEFTGEVSERITPNTIKCAALTRLDELLNPLVVSSSTNSGKTSYTYLLELTCEMIGFWFYDSVTGEKLDVDMCNLKIL
ncbi:hypothetical protein F-liban_468 [Faustovirus]|nr:hypothetical protein F-liban_468 [Faustovirus]SME65157.1 Hypothetical protein FSTVST1_456 [Faustovirus ST1]